ncbi:MAG: AMP-binding protein [Clostridiales bacterium]|nr:AMP-binding protein [Clostridiales bacterium]
MRSSLKNVEIYKKEGRRIARGTGRNKPVKIRDIKEMMKDTVEKYSEHVAFKYKKEGRLVKKTFSDFEQDVNALGTKLINMGLKDEKVAIIGGNSYKWSVSYMAVLNGVGVVVPLDKSLPQVEIENLINRSGVKAIFYSKDYQEIMENIASKMDIIDYYISLDEKDLTKDHFLSFDSLVEEGKKLLSDGDRSYIDVIIDTQKMSVLLFTSGTTKKSKGVMLSHRNLASNIESLTGVIRFNTKDVHLSLLPIHHTFENTIGFLFMFHEGACIAYCEGIRHIASNLKEFDVTILLAVPAIYEVMYEKIIEGIKKSGKEKLVNVMMKLSNILCSCGIDVRKKMLKAVIDNIAPNIRLMVSAAAPIDKKIIKFFSSLGIVFFQGYGLTETSPLVAVNTEDNLKIGTVGPPGYNIEVAIDNPDENGMGELLVKGENVMLGYYDNSDNENIFTHDGWFKTGDIAIIDEDGLLKITGREKSMIVFTNGKKAFPEEYEEMLNKIKGVKESFVWGDKSKEGAVQICAKIVIDENQDEKGLLDLVEMRIKEINKDLPQYKIIRYFVLTKKELVKTTTLKIKRNIEISHMNDYLEKNNCNMRKLNRSIIQ